MPTTDATIPEVLQTFFFKHQIKKGAPVAIAFSGGSDSLALLLGISHLLTRDQVAVFYVNHRLRPDAELSRELQLCRANCLHLGYTLEILDLGENSVENFAKVNGSGIEAAARSLRYEALFAACRRRGCGYLATAHNADDQLETMMMRLFQASSVSSLKGIEAYIESNDGPVLIRPLLGLPHKTLRGYVEQEGFQWSEDSTNTMDAYLRNQIRHTVKPDILSLFPNAYEAIYTMSKRFKDVAGMLQILEDEALRQVSIVPGEVRFPLAWYQRTMKEIRERLLFRLYGEVCGKEVKRLRTAMVARLQEQLDCSTTEQHFLIEAGKSRICLADGMVTWSSMVFPQHFLLPLPLPGKPQKIPLPGGVVFCIEEIQDGADSRLLRLDAESLENAVVRSVEEGDSIDLEVGSVSVARLLSSYGIHKTIHPMIPLLCDRSGVVAVFARMYGGRDRLARRFKTPLARRVTNIYSSIKRNDDSEIEK
ncbi:MAG: tRNA lysidine(34) synthetase TilS [Sphaerochaetaceae bacterium]